MKARLTSGKRSIKSRFMPMNFSLSALLFYTKKKPFLPSLKNLLTVILILAKMQVTKHINFTGKEEEETR